MNQFQRVLLCLLCGGIVAFAADADTRLSVAAMNGDEVLVETLLKQHVPVNDPQGDGSTALHWAAGRGDLVMARMLIAAGADMAATTRLGGITPLIMACQNGHGEMIKLLIQAGVKLANTSGTTPLMFAAASGSVDGVRALLDHGADVNAKDFNQGQTALMYASALNRVEVIKLLAARGADINAVSLVPTPLKKSRAGSGREEEGNANQNGEAPAKEAVPVGEQAAPRNARGGRGGGGNANQNGEAPAKGAVPSADRKPASNNEAVAVPVKEQAAPRNARGSGVLELGGMTALQFAAREGYKTAVEALVAAGADVNKVTASDKMSALTIAIMNGHLDLAKYLLDKGADPKSISTGGVTALYMLVDAQWAGKVWYPPPTMEQEHTSYLDLIGDILDHGADPNVKLGSKLWQRQFHGDWVDPTGATAFWRAAQADDVAGMKLLVSRGADPNIATGHGCSPLQVAVGYGYDPQISTFVPDARLAAAKYLIDDLHADTNAKDDQGYSPLHGAALTGDNDLIQYLVSRGADATARANQFFGRNGGSEKAGGTGMGDSVADMANGPRETNLVFPEAVKFLVALGSFNSDNCRASICNLKQRPDPIKSGNSR